MLQSYTSFGKYVLSPSVIHYYTLGASEGYYEITFPAGKYKIELWGASGGDTTAFVLFKGGKGGYVSGIITLRSSKTLYFYIGTRGKDSSGGLAGKGGYNGGSSGGNDNGNNDCGSAGSGCASDLRYEPGAWNSPLSLNSRILVAGAGASGGCGSNGGLSGHAGGLAGTRGRNNAAGTLTSGLSGNQTYGYKKGEGEPGKPGNEAGGSGGSGYWGGFAGGGTSGSLSGGAGGSGGSSYISGYPGCSVINGFIFTSTSMIPGNSEMPSTEDFIKKEETGHTGDGFARITCISSPKVNTCKRQASIPMISIFVSY